MPKIFLSKLKAGDKVMLIAPSDSLANISPRIVDIANRRLTEMGLEVVVAKNVYEKDDFDSSSIKSRVEDLHQAFLDVSVKGVVAAFGGYNSNQLLKYIDWEIIKNNPKVFVGFSDITLLQNAIYAKTGLVTYSGPNYANFGQELYFEYTLEYFKKGVFGEAGFAVLPSEFWSDDGWLVDQTKRKLMKNDGWLAINQGAATGTILGGNLCTFNLLQGTDFFPDLTNAILFLEDDSESSLYHFDRDLQSLIHQPDFYKVKGLVIGRFQKASQVKNELLVKLIKNKTELNHLPVLANADFGHTDQMITFPVGGEVKLEVGARGGELILS